jgi:hypothetical protein
MDHIKALHLALAKKRLKKKRKYFGVVANNRVKAHIAMARIKVFKLFDLKGILLVEQVNNSENLS